MHTQLADATGGRAYSVVMDGTARTPPSYTGRLAVPAFAPIAKLSVLKITTRLGEPASELPPDEWGNLRIKLGRKSIASDGGDPFIRSAMKPQLLATDEACGRLEDTRLAKRLYISPTDEIRSAYLSRLAFEHVSDLAFLLRQAAGRCVELGVPTLFTATPVHFASALIDELGELEIHQAPATVFGCGFDDVATDWWLDTAEI